MFNAKSMLTATLAYLASMQTYPKVDAAFQGRYVPNREGRRSAAREAAFRAAVNRRKPGRFRTAKV